jgi:hypothetical protein
MEEAKSEVIGRELKASEVREDTIVVVWKQGRPVMATMWVIAVSAVSIVLTADQFMLGLTRCGAGLEQVEDEDHVPMKLFEYLEPVPRKELIN